MKKEKIVKICVILFVSLGVPLGLILEKCYPNIKIYEGNGYGYEGYLTVKLKVNRENKIVGIEVKHEDTPTIANLAIKKIEKNLILKEANEELFIDEIAGASHTSQGVKEGIEDAIKKIKNK